MAFWPVRPDIVRNNLARFAARTGIAVAPLEIAGNYAATVEARFAAGDPPDVLYAQRGEAARWAASGLVEPLDGFAETPSILAEMLPLIRASSRDATGRVIGLTYYNAGPFCLFRNERLLGEIGRGGIEDVAAYPQDWNAVLADARALQRRGVVHPLLMRWYDAPTGIAWAFLAECFAEGEFLIDAGLNATFDIETPAATVLARWQTIWREGLVPHAVLDWDDARTDAAWMSGAHAYYATMDYLNALYADPTQSAIAGANHMNPVLPGRTHDTLLLGHAMLCLSAKRRSAADRAAAWRLLRYLGHRDDSGALFVHRRWAMELNLFVPYPEIYADPAVTIRMRGWHYPPLAHAALAWQLAGRARALRPAIVSAPWYMEWAAALHWMVRDDLLRGGRTPTDVIRALRALWGRLAVSR